MAALFSSLAQAALDHWDRATAEAQRLYKRSVRTVYSRRDDGRPEGVGSSVLVQSNGVKYLVTAAHVVDRGVNCSLHLAAGSGLSPLNATFLVTNLPSEGRKADHLDIAIAPLSETLINDLGDVHYIDLETETQSHFRPQDFFLVSGYRASQNKAPLANQTELKPKIWTYKSVLASVPDAEARGHGGAWNFAVNYDKKAKRASGEVVVNTPPEGVSGGAVFYLGNLADIEQVGSPKPHPPKLAGILIECPKKGGVLIATSIDAIKAVIRQSNGE